MSVAKIVGGLSRALLKALELWDGIRKRDRAKERSKREKEIEKRIARDSVRAANRLYGNGGKEK